MNLRWLASNHAVISRRMKGVRILSAATVFLAWTLSASAAESATANSAASPVAKTYRNPLLPEVSMADPHVIRVDGTYYLYATTHTKGYDAYTSRDLVNWTNAGRVCD